tara:strand:- start:697 stop:2106 length:1410 start_codon:yes stop_codon:yes gene_type:complete
VAQLTLQLLKGDKVDSRVDYRDGLPKNVSGVMRPVLGVDGYMLQQPGITLLGNGVGVDRGGIWNERFAAHYRLSATDFIEVSATGTYTSLGTILGLDTASLPYSFQTQAIVVNFQYWLYDPVNLLRQITDPDLGAPIDATWIDGYYVFTDGEYLYHTKIADESQIDPLQFSTSEFSPDPTVGVGRTTDNKLIAFNRYTTEYFYNQANEFFAFTRIPSRAVNYGLVATHAKAEIAGQWFFLGGPKEGDISVYALGVGQASSIASREVSQVIAQYTEAQLSETTLETRIVDEYSYLILNLPNEVLLYNLNIGAAAGKEQAWSILSSDVETGAKWRGLNGIFDPRISRWVYGDNQSGKIGYLNELEATQYDVLVECELYTPFIYLESASVDLLKIDTIPGFNTVDDATLFLSMTYDGVAYGMEVTLDYGAPGAYGKRLEAYRLGYVENWFGFKLRWASRSRMAFSRGVIDYG